MADNEQRESDPRFAIWIGTTVALFLAAAVVGVLVLPSAQRGTAAFDLWASICRAVGIPNDGGAAAQEVVDGQPSSTVAWTPDTRQMLTQGDTVKGAAQATTCRNCHGPDGISSDAAFPNLAGQSVAALYKQLQDFKTGERNAAVMGVYVDPLSQQDMVDVATYFSSLPKPDFNSSAGDAYPAAQQLAKFGAPMRGIAGCAACHDPQGLKQGAPPLEGQQHAYLIQQMHAFKAGTRGNDISEQMRSVARQLTNSEIVSLAAYYSEMAVSD